MASKILNYSLPYIIAVTGCACAYANMQDAEKEKEEAKQQLVETSKDVESTTNSLMDRIREFFEGSDSDDDNEKPAEVENEEINAEDIQPIEVTNQPSNQETEENEQPKEKVAVDQKSESNSTTQGPAESSPDSPKQPPIIFKQRVFIFENSRHRPHREERKFIKSEPKESESEPESESYESSDDDALDEILSLLSPDSDDDKKKKKKKDQKKKDKKKKDKKKK